MNHLKQKLNDLYAANEIHFAWNYTSDGWECVGEQITERGQDQLASHYIVTDTDFYSEALVGVEDRARACIDDGDALALGFLIRDSLRRQAVRWAMYEDAEAKRYSPEWADLQREDLEHEKAPHSQAGGF